MMYGLKLKAFYSLDDHGNVREEVDTGVKDKERQDLEELKTEMKSVEDSGNVKTEVLSTVSKEELAKFLLEKFFSEDDISYANFTKGNKSKTLNLCMRRALELISESDSAEEKAKKYDDEGKEFEDGSENGKRIDEWLKLKPYKGERDSTLIKILQTKLGLKVVDGKPGPQTVATLISRLGGNVSTIYDKVNKFYESNSDLKIWQIRNFTYGNINFHYDPNLFDIKGSDNITKIIDLKKEGDEGVELRVVDEGEDRHLEANGFVFDNGWLKKAEESSEGGTQDEEEKNPLDGLIAGKDYTEQVKNLIESNKNKFNITSKNQKDYIGVLNRIMDDPDKKGGLKSLLTLPDKFWTGYKIDLEGLNTLEQKLDSADLDGTKDTFETVDDEDDYLTIRGGKLVKIRKNYESHHQDVFEANGTSSWDDYRFDSVEAFMKFIGGDIPIKASEHVETISNEVGNAKDLLSNEEFNNYKNRFSDDLLKNGSAELQALEGDRLKTFLSMLTLGDNFWGDYKLTVKDVQDFKRGMEKDKFDYESQSTTVFHAEGSKFEVDGTGFRDKKFSTVSSFFDWLRDEI